MMAYSMLAAPAMKERMDANLPNPTTKVFSGLFMREDFYFGSAQFNVVVGRPLRKLTAEGDDVSKGQRGDKYERQSSCFLVRRLALIQWFLLKKIQR